MSDYSDWKYPALKKEANARGLSMAGKADEIRARLSGSDASPPTEPAPVVVKTKTEPVRAKRRIDPQTAPDPENHNYDLAGRWRRRVRGWMGWNPKNGEAMFNKDDAG